MFRRALVGAWEEYVRCDIQDTQRGEGFSPFISVLFSFPLVAKDRTWYA